MTNSIEGLKIEGLKNDIARWSESPGAAAERRRLSRRLKKNGWQRSAASR